MQIESEQAKSVSWNDIGQVLDTELSSVEDIRVDLARTEKGSVCQTINNCVMVLQRDPVLRNAIRKNELSGKRHPDKRASGRCIYRQRRHNSRSFGRARQNTSPHKQI